MAVAVILVLSTSVLTGFHSVTSYTISTATLTLGHSFLQGTNVSALVDVKLLLETLKSEQTRVGEWVNVIGYVTPEPARRKSKRADNEAAKVHIQALMLWPAGPLDVQRYDKHVGLEERASQAVDHSGSPSEEVGT